MTMNETMTRRQSNNQWSDSVTSHPTPKNSEYKNPLEKFSPRFLWDQEGILLIDYLQKGQTINAEYYSSLLVQLRDFWRKNFSGRSPRKCCSCTKMLRLTRHLQPIRNWPIWASSVLITHPILRIWPRRTTTCSLDWKNNRKVAIFLRRWGHCCRGDWVGRTTFWIFFWVACKI